MFKTIFKKAVIRPLKVFNQLLEKSKKINSDDALLLYDFNSCRDLILYRNLEKTIQNLMKIIRKSVLKTDGLLITDMQARTEALKLFKEMKAASAIDCINNQAER